MKLLLKLGIYFIIFLILYNIFVYLFSQNIIESLTTNVFNNSGEIEYETYTVPELQQKCKTKILNKYKPYEHNVERSRSCTWKWGGARKRCNRDNNAKRDRNNAKHARNNNRTNKIKDCLSSYTYSGFQKGYTDKTVYNEISNSHIVTEPPHTDENPFYLGDQLINPSVVNAVYNDDSMNTALTTMIDTEIDNGLNYDNYKTKYKTQLTENLKEKYKEQELQRRKEFVDVDDDQIIGNNYDPGKGSLLIEDGNEQYSELQMGGDDDQMSSLNTINDNVYGISNEKFKDKYQTQANNYLKEWAAQMASLSEEQKITGEDINTGVQT